MWRQAAIWELADLVTGGAPLQDFSSGLLSMEVVSAAPGIPQDEEFQKLDPLGKHLSHEGRVTVTQTKLEGNTLWRCLTDLTAPLDPGPSCQIINGKRYLC